MIVGTALWGYGLLVTGTTPIIDWKSNAPLWIADRFTALMLMGK
jgi:hypothetical protein